MAVFDFQQVKLELINHGLLSLVATSWVGNSALKLQSPETNSSPLPRSLLKRKGASSNHQFSGVTVDGRIPDNHLGCIKPCK